MSSDMILAKRYAKALFAVAEEKSAVKQVEGELKSVIAALESYPEFKKVLIHPNIQTTSKLESLRQIFEDRLSEPVFNVLQLVIRRGREGILSDLLDKYIAIADEASGQALATVYSPIALSETETAGIAHKFSEMVGKNIRVEAIEDPSVLGGIRVRIGDRLYDGSLQGKLDRLQKSLRNIQAM